MKISDEDRERYDIPHVDEIQQALMEDKEFLRAEAEAVQEDMLEQAKVDEELFLRKAKELLFICGSEQDDHSAHFVLWACEASANTQVLVQELLEKHWLESEAEFDKRDEVYPEDEDS
tara:strand:+ start:171 stop:524 length:354 start_codon:yes stop_codon:yes gene_type:complete